MASTTQTETNLLLVSCSENPGSPKGGRPTSLEALETSVISSDECDDDPVPVWLQTHIQHVIHRRWMPTRKRIYTAWHRSGDDSLAKRAEKLNMCCASPLVEMCVGGSTRTRMMRCRDRLCPLCSIRRSEILGAQLVNAVAQMDDPRHVVLTAPAIDDWLRDQIDGLRVAFRALRRHPAWTGSQQGGVYSIEVTRNAKTGLWHPHLHIISDGDYLPHNSLVDAWSQALRTTIPWAEIPAGARTVVWVERVGNRRRLADYIGKYVAKPAELDQWPDEPLCEYATAMRGARLVHAFGSLHGKKLGSDDEPNEQPQGEKSLAVLPIIRAARAGDLLAISVCVASTRHGHAWDRWAGMDPPPEALDNIDAFGADESAWWDAVLSLHYECDTGLRSWLRARTPEPEPPLPPWW